MRTERNPPALMILELSEHPVQPPIKIDSRSSSPSSGTAELRSPSLRTDEKSKKRTNAKCLKMVNFEIDQFVWLSSTYVSLIIETFIFDANIPFWLGRIIKPPDDIASTSEEAQHFVRLCGTKRCFWMLEENIHHLLMKCFRNAAESNFILKTLVEVLDVGDLTDPKPKSSTKDFLKNDELTKNCTAVWSPEDISKFPFIREEELSKKFHRYGTLNRKINHAKGHQEHSPQKQIGGRGIGPKVISSAKVI
ncbi:hypothetical protein TNCT_424931 [Trichonephila clavata]|uniref:Uncharacterized protein n=1 Tax=Trichonephila clavata TaxID=2740835 RepID=A0A8X6KZJ3_TRICU|nr:hypothetical protein TNCT_424931 [Trichonephila clavata]